MSTLNLDRQWGATEPPGSTGSWLQPVLEKRLDHYISGVRRDDRGIEWEFSRKRQIGLGL